MDRNHTHTPPEVFNRWLAGSIGFLLILLVTVHGFSTGDKLMLLALVAIPIGILFVNRLTVWYMAIFSVFYSWIYIPGLPQSLSLFHILAVGIIPFLFAGKLLGRPAYGRSGWVTISVFGFLAIVLVTMSVRGFGLRFSGGNLWGGAFYLHLIIAILFYLLSNQVELSERQWQKVVVLFFAMAIVPVLAEWAFLLSKGRFYGLYYLIRPEGASARSNAAKIVGSQSGILRFQMSKHVALLFPMSLAMFPFKGKFRITVAIFFVTACIFAGLSGHRSAAIYLLLLVPTLIFFQTRKFPVRLILVYAMGLIAIGGLLAVAGRTLPLAVQRAVSWFPFADLSVEAKQSADVTTFWRLDLWRRLLEFLPDYWLVGRGLTFDSTHLWMVDFSRHASIDRMIVSHNYHSGPLSLLIDFGVVGLVCGSGIMLFGALRHYRLLAATWHSATLQRCHQVLLASYCVDVFRFYLIMGDAHSYLVALLLQIAIMEGLCNANARKGEAPLAATPETAPMRRGVSAV